MIAIMDYGVGNLFSLQSSFAAIGVQAVVTGDAAVLHAADKIILPGVGAFGDAAQKLRDTHLDEAILREASDGKLILGICLGMQLLLEESHEYGVHKGLGLIPGSVQPISSVIPHGLKIPHIGWNALHIHQQSPLMQYVAPGDYVYFVHSYYAADCAPNTIASAEYGVPLTAAVGNKNVFGCQFHPEKSGRVGLGILKAFAEMREEDLC